ncbi:hypothetical protein GE061_005262 [Apolygus lucorum]|uniref:Uncharacterized protein n=1 Tax=Apolygus lucorum TaxID=248454 RepID=A0A8S9WZP6_APOLU|nr:hypothetical protein GE061_005262 [Apolygus lucorum]
MGISLPPPPDQSVVSQADIEQHHNRSIASTPLLANHKACIRYSECSVRNSRDTLLQCSLYQHILSCTRLQPLTKWFQKIDGSLILNNDRI